MEWGDTSEEDNDDGGMSEETEPSDGNGYSKRGEASKGVPTMDDGEWSWRSARLNRGLFDLASLAVWDVMWAGGSSDDVWKSKRSAGWIATVNDVRIVLTALAAGTRTTSSNSGSGVGA